MSMSSLSAQLASLQGSSSKSNAGSSFASSKRHSDALGRGLSHSTKHGHSIHNNTKHKPSILYTDSKSASDVPLTTLRENCVSSLRQLNKLTNNHEFVSPKYITTLAGIHSLQMERGLATISENDKIDSIIQDLFSLLSTAMCEDESTTTTSSSTSCFSSSLHVIEYLLRRHDVHAREATACMLITCVLPLHEEPVFGRVLQLVNVASLPTFSFLRPHAAAATSAPLPNRTLLAKYASRDNALVKLYCQMGKRAAEIHSRESDQQQEPRRGVSRIISFSAAVLIQALNIQTTSTKYHGSISESTLRILFPYVLLACGDSNNNEELSLGIKCADWRGFGHVLASCICEYSVLSREARTTLATSIVKGALETARAYDDDNNESNENSVVERVADCMATLMAVLVVSPKTANDNTNDAMSKLSIISSSDKRLLGYSLPVSTYKALIQLEECNNHNLLSNALGHLYSNCDLCVTPIVASIIALATVGLSKEHEKSIHVICNLASD